MAATLKHFNMQISDAHSCMALQHGQSWPASLMLMPASEPWLFAIPADIGRSVRVVASTRARMNRKLRIVINRYNLPINWSTHGFVGRFGVEILFLTHR